MKKKIKLILFIITFFNFFLNYSYASLQNNLINKYKSINTLQFDFTQQIGNNIETGNCFIKYPLLMRCEYPKKKKSIIANGKKFAIIKKRYKKIYFYPLKKTPLYYLLNKENILNVIKNYEPTMINSNMIEYEIKDNNLNKLNIFFHKNSLELSGWKTMDAYSNEVTFVIKNLKKNILIEDKFFKIPLERDL